MMKYSPKIVNRIIEQIEQARGRTIAAKVGGIHYSTFLEWMKNHPEFVEKVEAAEDRAFDYKADLCELCIVRSATRGDWRAAIAWLERKKKLEWSKESTLNLNNLKIVADLEDEDE